MSLVEGVNGVGLMLGVDWDDERLLRGDRYETLLIRAGEYGGVSGATEIYVK